jgi:cob(I)alamin adenosyltransferase
MWENLTCLIILSFIMNIYTKKGDKGETRVLTGNKLSKSSDLICALGEIDELNSFLGWASCVCMADCYTDGNILNNIKKIQQDLYKMAAELAGSGKVKISDKNVSWLESNINATCEWKKVHKFTRPGERGELSSRVHICRCVCRRAERAVCKLAEERGETDGAKLAVILKYLNRLSDLLFAMSEY